MNRHLRRTPQKHERHPGSPTQKEARARHRKERERAGRMGGGGPKKLRPRNFPYARKPKRQEPSRVRKGRATTLENYSVIIDQPRPIERGPFVEPAVFVCAPAGLYDCGRCRSTCR